MNICYGGSFNPPTIAHQAIAKALKDNFKPENLIIIPTGDNYHLKDMVEFKHRYNMCKIAFSGDIILDIESHKDKYKGTLATLNSLSCDYDDLYFCMGADNLITIKKWIKYEELLSKYKFIVFRRNEINVEDFILNNINEFKQNIIIVDFDNDLSSSKFRKTKNKDIVDINVLKYIDENNLYEEE